MAAPAVTAILQQTLPRLFSLILAEGIAAGSGQAGEHRRRKCQLTELTWRNHDVCSGGNRMPASSDQLSQTS